MKEVKGEGHYIKISNIGQNFLRTRPLVIATVPRYATIKALATPQKKYLRKLQLAPS